MLTPLQKRTAQAIVNIFETGVVTGDYGNVTLIPGDTGHLTFGRSRTTLGSGNLAKLLGQYCNNAGARFGGRIRAALGRFITGDPALDTDLKMHNLLRATADDPVMRATQDSFFDETYWQPAEKSAERAGIETPLGLTVVYDSTLHGSWKSIRDRTIQRSGTISSLGEKRWIEAYVRTRRQWLAGHQRKDLRATVYRMDAFKRLIDQDDWGLELPLVVRGLEISEAALNSIPPGCYDGPQPGSRILELRTPMLRGLDVRLVQLGLSDHGYDVQADGIFGKSSMRSVRAYQLKAALPVTGVMDSDLIARLVT
jgi:chitosanase